MPTTLAVQVRLIFQKFSEYSMQSNSSKTITILGCWRLTFYNSDEDNVNFLDALSLVRAAMERLLDQVKNSKLLDEDSSMVARTLLIGLRGCLLPDIFHRNVVEFREKFSQDKLGVLGMLSNSLKLEHPEGTLSADEISKLVAEVEHLIKAIDGSGINSEIKHLLKAHASFMIWALNNIGLIGFQGIYESLARVMITAQRLPDEVESVSETKNGFRLKAVVSVVCKRIAQAMRAAETVDKGIKTLEDLGDGGAQLLDHIDPFL